MVWLCLIKIFATHIPYSLNFLREKIFADFTDFCQTTKILTLKFLSSIAIQYNTSKFLPENMLHHNISLDFSSFFTLSSSPTRSHSLSILCKHSSIDSHRYSFFTNSIYFWNRIPFSILSVPRRSTFKHLLYKFLCSV